MKAHVGDEPEQGPSGWAGFARAEKAKEQFYGEDPASLTCPAQGSELQSLCIHSLIHSLNIYWCLPMWAPDIACIKGTKMEIILVTSGLNVRVS